MSNTFRHSREDPEYIPFAVVCDLDGTLAHLNRRDPYNTATCYNDLVNEPVLLVLQHLKTSDVLVFVSGRMEHARRETERWLRDKCRFYRFVLFMRPNHDYRPDTVVKQEIYTNHIKDKYYVDFVLDDRTCVVNMWREFGLTCFQVAPGDF